MMGMGQRRIEISDDEAARTAALWGPDPVHPTSAAYRIMADAIESDLSNPDSKYTNPASTQWDAKKMRADFSMERASWVAGCSAALSRRDSAPTSSRSVSQRGRNTPSRAFAHPLFSRPGGDTRRGSGFRGKRSGGAQYGGRYRGGRGSSF
jgi:hypothetical protein